MPRQSSPVFISYAHVDDLKYAGEGWVTQFATTLVQLLARETDRDTITDLPLWIDQRMNAGDGIDPTIEKAIADAVVFIPIVSTAYLRSKYCLRKLDAFCRQDYKGRIVPVLIGTNGMKVELEPLKSPLWAEFATFDQLQAATSCASSRISTTRTILTGGPSNPSRGISAGFSTMTASRRQDRPCRSLEW
jgi:TIR domain